MLRRNGALCKDPVEICKAFKDHFIQKVDSNRTVSSLEDIFPLLQSAFPSAPAWDLSPCSEDDVALAIDNLKCSMACGPDEIPNRLLKELKHLILAPLTQIINLSIELGRFPSIWKLSKIVPVHKRNCKLDVGNYRPIALTSTLGKVLEGVVYSQFHHQLETLLPDNIYGFRSSRGTQDALTDLLDYVKTQKAAGKYVAILSIDATAAFDLLSHDLVLGSLKLLGFGPLMIAWSCSFFEDCRQFVQINKTWYLTTDMYSINIYIK